MKLIKYFILFVLAAALSVLSLNRLPYPFVWVFLVWAIFFALTAARQKTRVLKILSVNLCLIAVILMVFESALWIAPDLGKEDRPTAQNETVGTYTNNYFTYKEHVGYGPKAGITSTAKRVRADQVLYDVFYTIDDNGLRATPPPKNPDSKAVLVFGCSYTIGEGVNDHEAMPYRIAELSDRAYYVFNFGFHGYGPHQMLGAVESDFVDNIINDIEPVLILYQTTPFHVERSAGFSTWDKDGPMYKLTDDGEAVRVGTFRDKAEAESLSWTEEQLQKSSVVKRLFAAKQVLVGSEEDVDLMAAIVEKSVNIAAEKWPEAEFHLLYWSDGSKNSPLLEKAINDRGINLHHIKDMVPDISGERHDDYFIPIDRHPSALAHDAIAKYVVEELLQNK